MLNRIIALFGQNSQTRNYAVLSSIDLETPKNERLRAFDTVMATNERAIIHKSDEDLEVEWYLHRGRKLADQAHWAQLCEEIRHFDGSCGLSQPAGKLTPCVVLEKAIVFTRLRISLSCALTIRIKKNMGSVRHWE